MANYFREIDKGPRLKRFSSIATSVILVYCLLLPSCQTVQGMGKDMSNLGRAVVPVKRTAKKSSVVVPDVKPALKQGQSQPRAQREATEKKSPAAPPVKKMAPEKNAGKNLIQGMWEGVFKRNSPKEEGDAQTHGKAELSDLDPQLVKQGMFSERETNETMVLEDLPSKTDIDAIPATSGNWSDAKTVDVNGDGIPDVRYRQRN